MLPLEEDGATPELETTRTRATDLRRVVREAAVEGDGVRVAHALRPDDVGAPSQTSRHEGVTLHSCIIALSLVRAPCAPTDVGAPSQTSHGIRI